MESDSKLIAPVLDLFAALALMPPPTPGFTIGDVPQLTLARIASTHEKAARALALATGLPAPLISYALLRAMQMASVAGVGHSETSAQNVIDIATRIALRMNSESTALPN